MLRSNKQRLEWLEQKLQISLPQEFSLFWEFACSLRPLEPLAALEDSLGIFLVGGFEVLAGKFDHYNGDIPISLNWRYSLDPPEFFTLLAGGDDRWHAGYYIDSPDCKSYCVASYYANQGLQFNFDGRSLFTAVQRYLNDKEMVTNEDQELLSGPELEANKKAIEKVRKALAKYQPLVKKLKFTKRATCLKTIDGVGVVADVSTLGEINKEIKNKIPYMVWSDNDHEKVLQEAFRLLSLDKPGTALKLAKDLWQVGDEHRMRNSAEVMQVAYKQLARQPFGEILKDHLAYFNREWLDILDASKEPN